MNAVAPGHVATPEMLGPKRVGKRDLAAACRRIPMRRLGDPAEIAEVAAFLLSGAASYVTGSIYVVDGGHAARGDVDAAGAAIS